MTIPSDLIESLQQKSCGVFIGAGLSRAAGLPSWKDLMRELIKEAKSVPGITAADLGDYNKLIKDRSKYLVLASMLKRDLGKQFDDYISRRFGSESIAPTTVHRLVARLPAKLFITTNYDNLVEQAYSRLHKGMRYLNPLTYKQVGQLASCLHRNELFILKAHGDAKTEPEDVVLTERDYRELVFTQQGYQSFLQTVFTTNRMLFLGASMDDFDLRLLLGFLFTSYHGKTPIHYAVMHEDEKTSAEASALFHDFNINVLTFSDANLTVGLQRWLQKLLKKV